MSVRGVIFDFDGVIADTETLHLRAFQEALADTELSLTRDAYYERYLGYDDVGVFTALARDHDATLATPQLEHLVTIKGGHLERLRGTADVLFSGAADCIRRLAAFTTLGIASGALRGEIEAILTERSLEKYFAVIVGAEDVQHTKPAPDAYLTAVTHIADGKAPRWSDYVAIEDSPWGLDAARSAGLKLIGITNSYSAAKLAGADIVVDRLSEIDQGLLESISST